MARLAKSKLNKANKANDQKPSTFDNQKRPNNKIFYHPLYFTERLKTADEVDIDLRVDDIGVEYWDISEGVYAVPTANGEYELLFDCMEDIDVE